VSIPFGTEHLPTEQLRTKHESLSNARRSDAYVEEALRWLADDAPEVRGGGPGHSQAAGTEPVSILAPVNTAAEQVLLADDNPDMREYVARLLSERYKVVAVSNGEEALNAAISNPPDLILSDVMMPGLDGFGLLKELRNRSETRTIPVLLLSARAGEESRLDGLGAGADDYLIKPFTARELLARVATHLSTRKRRREAEDAMKQSQATLQSFYDSSPFLMGVVEIEGEEIVPIYCNAATANFYGTDVEALPGQSSKELGIPRPVDDLWVKKYRQSRSEGRSVGFEYQHPKPSGSVWLSAHVNYLGEGPGGRPRFSFVAEDITGRRMHEELLRRSNDELRRANADLEQFAYSASHDLQEPLRQVAIYSQLLERKYASNLDGKALEYLSYCVEGAHRMEMLISDLLAYSQATRGADSTSELVEMNEVVEAVKKNLATTISETGAVISAAGLPVVQGDQVPLMHVFQNLVSNALKYRSQELPRVTITAARDNALWRFAVEDNGIGIEREFHEQIFGIFKRLHDRKQYPGTGMGLAICQKIVERYGGRIWVESEPGKGSTFFFTVPYARTNS
jgi:PAS domain S-box-containing protein